MNIEKCIKGGLIGTVVSLSVSLVLTVIGVAMEDDVPTNK